MNCDQAFELMTDGLLDHRVTLQAHLDSCPRCQQMYETLSPALGLFESAADIAADRFHPASASSSVEIAERIAVRLTRSTEAPQSARSAVRALPAVIAMGLLGVVALFGFAAVVSPTPSSAPFLSDDCTWLNRDTENRDRRAAAVVLSCVACHLDPPAETTDVGRRDGRIAVLARLVN